MAIGLGCMRLSTERARDDASAARVLAAALDAGVDVLDTADAYALEQGDVGHNERLIAAALAGRAADAVRAAPVRVITKGGLTRPGGAWVPDGRARHLAAAARASRERLNVAVIDTYLLHAIDPRTPLATSVRALARLRDDGVVRRVGLSNVNAAQLADALAITAIDAVEVELSPWRVDALRGGLIAACEARDIALYAHRPLGGPAGVKRLERDPVVAAIAARTGATPAQIAIAWLRTLSPVIVPIPGATRVETAIDAARAAAITLDDDAIAALRGRFVEVGDAAVAVAVVRSRAGEAAGAASTSASASASASGSAPGEVVLIAGMPAAGKSTLAADYVARGYTRLNRDDRGGSLLDLARALDRELAAGAVRVVLDNTYATRASRAPVVEIARRHGASVRCVLIATPIEQAQAYAVTRLLERHGRLLEPDELSRAGEIAPNAQFRWRRELGPPAADEGFDAIDEIVPPRRDPRGARPALIVELDELIWRGRPVDAAAIEPTEHVARLAAWHARGYAIAGTLWRPDAADAAGRGSLQSLETPSATSLQSLETRLAQLIGAPIAIACCPHPAGPPVCWCRKPLPGLGFALARAHDLDLARSLHVGRGPADRGFAQRLGVTYIDVGDGFPSPPAP